MSGQPQPVAEPQPRVADSLDDANAELAAEGDDEVFASADVSTIPPAGNGKPAHYWTWRVFTAGFSLDEARQIRNLDRAALIQHLLAAVREGCAVDAGWIFTTDQQRELRRLLANGNAVESANVRLPEGIPRGEVELYLTLQRAKAGVHAHQP